MKKRQSQDDEEHSKETKQNPKTTKQAEHTHKIERAQTEKTTDPKNAGARDNLDRKKALVQTPKQQNNNNNNNATMNPLRP